MRHVVWFAASIALAASVFGSAMGGCSNESTPVSSGDAGTSSSTSSGGSSSGGSSSGGSSSGTPSGGTPTPGKIACGSTTCSTPEGCCYDTGLDGDAAITISCMPNDTCQGRRVECDDNVDCNAAGGEICCGEILEDGRMTGKCQLDEDCPRDHNDEPVLCQTNAECDGGPCTEYTCPVIGKVKACIKPLNCN
jgi:hypothetical protein